MFKGFVNLVSSPLTKYMAIAILVLLGVLGGALYLSYNFYGDKKVAEAASEQLEVAVEEERVQTEKAVKSSEIINQAVVEVRKGEKALDKASQKLQEEIIKSTPTNPTVKDKDDVESVTEPCTDFISDDDIGMLRKAHCLTDGDPSDCN